jgi:polysaccharide export outer membrane protein
MKTILLQILMLQAVSFAQVQPTALVTSTAIEPGRLNADTNVPRDYRLTPGDVIDIRFFYNPELNEQQIAIRPDGRVQLQLVGDYEIGGKTPEQASREMERIYSHTLKTPSVTVQVRNFAMNRIFVTGEVPKPGLVNLNGPLSVLTALGEVGGISTKGNRKTVFLIRRSESGTAERYQVALYDHGQPTPEATAMLRPFDVILVPEAKVARLDRWVDEYIKQLSPANLVVGFQYLMQNSPAVPVF